MKSKLQKLTLLAALMSASVFAQDTQQSTEFSIANKTSHTLSFTINKVCSSELGDVKEHSVKSLQWTDIIKACSGSAPCKITAYDQAGCTGEKIGYAHYTIDPFFVASINYSTKISLGVSNLGMFFDEYDQQA